MSISGASADIVRDAPTERRFFTVLGLALIFAAFFSATSAGLASSFIGLSSALASPIGASWGIVMLNVNRLLIFGLIRRRHPASTVLGFLPFLLLSAVTGFVTATPIILAFDSPHHTETTASLIDRLNGLTLSLSSNSLALPLVIMSYLVLASVEMLPVLMKSMRILGPITLYERLEHRYAAHANRLIKIQEETELTIMEHAADMRIRASQHADAMLVDQHMRITEHALNSWSRFAAMRTDEMMAAWLDQAELRLRTNQPPPEPPTIVIGNPPVVEFTDEKFRT